MKRPLFTAAIFLTACSLRPASAQMASGDRMTDFGTVFRVDKTNKPKNWTVAEINSSLGTNALFPGESISLDLRFQNMGADALTAATLEMIPYDTSVPAGDVWVPTVFRTPGLVQQNQPIALNVPAKGSAVVTVTPPIPEHFGAYGLVIDMGDKGRMFVGTVARVIKPDFGPVAYPAYSLDMPRDVTPSSMGLFKRIGAKTSRMELGAFDITAPDADKKWADLDEKFKLMRDNDVTVMLTVNNGGLAQPLGRSRPHLSEDGILLNTKSDLAALPSTDPQFRDWVKAVCLRYGFPKGPVNAMELWNEPWEGISISGWGADSLRYREIYKAMAQGVLDARKEGKVQVLIGGASSSSNTLDKLFSDGKDDFLPILDFASIHYQAMSAVPSLIKKFQDRKPTPVQTWDTESWIANSADRVAVVIASMRAMGQDSVKGIFAGNVLDTQQVGADGKKYDVTQAWSVAPAIAAMTKFIGNRKFAGLVFPQGLPWVFTFEGAPAGAEPGVDNPDNGTLVVVGDLGGAYDRGLLLYRNVLGLANVPMLADAKAKLAALPATATKADQTAAQNAVLRAQLLAGASLTFPANPHFLAFDATGNPIAAKDGKFIVPLDTLGYYLRTDGSRGSFEALKQAVAAAQITGYEPVDIVAHDFTSPLASKPALRLSVHNILNRPVQGSVSAKLASVTFDAVAKPVTLAPGETKDVTFTVTAGQDASGNAYALDAVFDGGQDGKSELAETVHCNVIGHKTIKIDGDLNDWQGVLPQPAGGQGIAANLTEKAWLPFEKYDESASGVASGYLAYDAQNFYFAAKIADSTPDDGTIDFSKRDDDQFFYPPVAYDLNPVTSIQKKDTVVWTDSEKPIALQKPEGTGRELGMYETTTTKSLAMDVLVPKGRAQQVALYFADPDQLARRHVFVEMLDENNNVLDKHEIKTYSEGVYLVYTVTGKVRFKVTTAAGLSGSLSAVFFDPNTQAMNELISGFVRQDDTTHGDWKGKYGTSGYSLAALGQEKLPAGVTIQPVEILDKTPLTWPEGVRRYSYRMRPILPFSTGDDVQIAFNVVPNAKKAWLMNPPHVPEKWMAYPDTDYEYSLLTTAAKYGGGTQVWRLNVPGMPRKHFYPRQPKWAGDGVHTEGAVQNAKLVTKRDGNTRIVELAIPWSEIPDVKAHLDRGEPIKFSYRVGDNKGQPYELAQDRSVSKVNFPAFHPDWNTHWANELEFGWAK